MNYVLDTLDFQLQINKEFNTILFEQMESEHAFIMNCLENLMVVTEATVENKENKVNIFKKITEFIKKIFTMFTAKAKALFKSNKPIIDEQLIKLDKVDFDGLQIEMIPFWAMDLSKLQSMVNKNVNTVTQLSGKVNKKYNDMDSMKKGLFSDCLDSEGDMANGLKNLFRTGNSKVTAKAVVLKDAQLKSQVLKEFRPYCSGYEANVIPFVKKSTDSVTRALELIERTIDQRSSTNVNEAFCVIENSHYSGTELSFLPVMEAEEPATPDKTEKKEEPKSDEKQPVTKVTLSDRGTKQDGAVQDKAQGMNDTGLLYHKNLAQISQLIVTSLMTTLEERFNAYMNAMKEILKARAPKETSSEEKK